MPKHKVKVGISPKLAPWSAKALLSRELWILIHSIPRQESSTSGYQTMCKSQPKQSTIIFCHQKEQNYTITHGCVNFCPPCFLPAHFNFRTFYHQSLIQFNFNHSILIDDLKKNQFISILEISGNSIGC